MAQRTTIADVQTLLGSNYGTDHEGNDPDLQPYIDTATVIVDRVVTCATAKNYTHTAAELELIERWLAAHYYTRMDPTYTSKSTAGASGSFTSPKDDTERYRASAIELDASGCLKQILSRNKASAAWLGKVPSDQIPYEQRR